MPLAVARWLPTRLRKVPRNRSERSLAEGENGNIANLPSGRIATLKGMLKDLIKDVDFRSGRLCGGVLRGA